MASRRKPAGQRSDASSTVKRAAALWFCCRIADLPVHHRRIDASLRTRNARGQAFERRFDPPAKLVVHGLLFAAPIGRAAQDHGLRGLGMTRELDLDALVHRAPAARGGEFSLELLQLRLRRPDDVAPTSLPKPCQNSPHSPCRGRRARRGPACRAAPPSCSRCLQRRESCVLPANTS